MNAMKLSIRLLFANVLLVLGFNSNYLAMSVSMNEPSQSSSELEALCKSLSEIKKLPFKGEAIDDEVYNKIIKQGDKIVPCLIEKITNTAKMRDPRTAPTYPNFKVGDLAFFLLLEVTKTPLEQMLPDAVKRQIKDEGIYAYFRYVERFGNRNTLQENWKAWLKKQGR
jgi:hypothetical protein